MFFFKKIKNIKKVLDNEEIRLFNEEVKLLPEIINSIEHFDFVKRDGAIAIVMVSGKYDEYYDDTVEKIINEKLKSSILVISKSYPMGRRFSSAGRIIEFSIETGVRYEIDGKKYNCKNDSFERFMGNGIELK